MIVSIYSIKLKDEGSQCKDDRIEPKRKVKEANAWIKKYLTEASVDKDLGEFIRGIKARRLISNPNQAPRSEVEETEIIEPEINSVENKRIKLFVIKKGHLT